MRILHLIHRYWPAPGGSEHFFRVAGRYLRDHGHDVEVWTTNAEDIEAFWQRGRRQFPVGRQIIDGIPVERFQVRALPQHARLVRVLSTWPVLRPVVHFPSPLVPGMFFRLATAKERFDLVHVTALPYTSLFYFAQVYAKRCRARLVCSPFLHLAEDLRDEVARFYTRTDQLALLAASDLCFVQTETEARFLRSSGVPEEKLCLLGMGVDPQEFPPSQWEQRAARFRSKHAIGGPLVFNLTVQSHDKGSLFLIQAVNQLWQNGVNVELVLAGPRTLDFDRRFERLAADVRRRCRVLGTISEEEKKDLLAAGDILAHPSRTDSFGIVYLEAWCHEKPVIGARAGGVPDVIREGQDGELVEFGNVEQLAGTLQDLLNDPQRRAHYGRQGRRKVLASFTWDRKCAILLEQLERITQNRTIGRKVTR